MSINNSSRVSIKGKNTFNHVHGHQFNGPIYGNAIFNAEQAVVKRTEYDEFEYVKRGHIVSMKEIHSEKLSEWDWKWQNGKLFCRYKSAQRTIYTVEIIDRQSKFTAMIYEGEDARDAWEDDFREFSQIKNPGSVRLFGINQSAIPALIFHHELIPLGHIFTGSFWMSVYIAYLSSNLGCNRTSLWMNTASEMLFSGPEGPYFFLSMDVIKSIVVPRTVDMLKDDTFLRFFSKFGSKTDLIVLTYALISLKVTYLDDLFPVTADPKTEDDPDDPAWISPKHPYIRDLWRNLPRQLPMSDIGGLRFDAVYSPLRETVAKRPQRAGSLWEFRKSPRRGLVDETVLDGGLTRFKLDLTEGGEVYLVAEYDRKKFRDEWLSQSCRIFDGLDVTKEEELCIIDPSDMRIQSTSRREYESLGVPLNLCDGKHPVKETQPPSIYLFLCPLPMTLSAFVSWMNGHFYFWSFDETGRCQMSEEERKRWGLAALTCTTRLRNDSIRLLSWPTSTYTALRNWQKARGFDPATSDWARELGYPEWEIVGASRSNTSLSKLLTLKKTMGSSWWEAFAGSGISACGL